VFKQAFAEDPSAGPVISALIAGLARAPEKRKKPGSREKAAGRQRSGDVVTFAEAAARP